MYDSETLTDIQQQLSRARSHELYEQKFSDADVDPSNVTDWENFTDVPFTEPEELKKDFDDNAPQGSLYTDSAMITFSPLGDDLAPVYDTTEDLAYEGEIHAELFKKAGITADDRVVNTFGYHLFGTGYILQRGLEHLGAEVIPVGPGDSEQAADIISTYDADVLLGNPSFALKIGEKGAEVDLFVGAGEPFTSVPGYRQKVKKALNCNTAIDYFGTRQFLPIAAETTDEDGLYVADEYVIVELVDPDTGEPLELGQRGELVVTHRRKEGLPLVRYRTGDLAELERRGDDLVLPNGVIGRTDNRLKVKGVKVYPETIPAVLAGFDDLSGEYRVTVTQPDTTDHVSITCEGTANTEEVTDALAERLLITPDEVSLVDDLDETGVFDKRYK